MARGGGQRGRHGAEGEVDGVTGAGDLAQAEPGGAADRLGVQQEEQARDAGGGGQVRAVQEAAYQGPAAVVADHGHGAVSAGTRDGDGLGAAVGDGPGDEGAGDVAQVVGAGEPGVDVVLGCIGEASAAVSQPPGQGGGGLDVAAG
ncbi:hypothetical protein GCM10017744_077890 [Streptomyces antimycoticus]